MKKTLRISFNGKTYEVVAELLGEDEAAPAPSRVAALAPAPVAAAAAAPAAAAPRAAAPASPASGGADGVIPSPLAGKVVSIDVKPGDTVAAGAQLATLEAMKMNTLIYAPRAGRVAAVHANPGDAVEEGQPLLSLT